MPAEQNVWGEAVAYERYMGRWSRKVAPLFTEWVGVSPRAALLDVGCGTGVLTSVVLDLCAPSRVVGIDSATNFLSVAEGQLRDPRVSFKKGEAGAIPEADDSFDAVVSGLVLNFVSDKDVMMREMVRVARPGGTVALYVWDYAGHMQLMRYFFDAATMLDPSAREFDDGVKAPVCRPRPLSDLLVRTGLTDVQVQALDIPMAFANFEEYWRPFLGGTGSAPKYCVSLAENARQQLREELRRQLPTGPDGEILLAARAWAAKGVVAK